MSESEIPDEVVLSHRCEDATDFVGSSERRECCACGADVWASPATRRSIDEGVYPDEFCCTRCMMNDLEGDDER